MPQLPIPLPADEHPSRVIHVNARAQIHQEGEVRALVVGGIPLLTWSAADAAAEAYAMVLQVRGGFASPTEVARAHGSTRMTVYRAHARFEEQGLPGLVRGKRGPKTARVLGDVAMRRMVVLKRRGVSNGGIASHLGVTESGIRKALRRIGYSAPTPVQGELRSAAPEGAAATEARRPEAPGADAEAHDIAESSMEGAAPSTTRPDGGVPGASAGAPPPPTEAVRDAGAAASEPAAAGQAEAMTAGDPWDRTADRVWARMGLLSEAPPQFGDCKDVAGLGVLLALPVLLATGVLDIAVKVYGRFGAAFFGVRSVFVCLALMALLRVKRAEHLRHCSPPMLGRLLGLDRAPEVKTLRRKVGQLAQQGKSEEFQRALAQRRVAAHPEAMGFLYVDGHVRVYTGKVTLPKAHVTRMRLSMPATVDHWVNDRDGEPLLVLTATPTASLAKELLAIAREVRRLLGDRRATIVFDRGGWSPKLFAVLIGALGFDILTYRKGRIPTVRKKSFRRRDGHFDGRPVVYRLAERKLTVKYKGGTLALREVVRLSEDGAHQTSIVTSRTDLADVEVAYRMFERWRQENFFKYMGDEFEIDALWSYGTEEADPDRDVPNPARKQPERALREARAEVARLERVLGAAATLNEESTRPTMRGFKIANASVGKPLRTAHARVDTLREALRRIPKRVSARQAANGEPVVRLKTETKRLTDTLKSVAYQAETALLRLIRPHYRRHEDEGRKLLASAMQLSGDIAVGPGELRITLEPAASPNRTQAIARLCDELNATQIFYPGTRLRLRYAIREA
jgi:prepilin-type processing-associated H-X9-DG protein